MVDFECRVGNRGTDDQIDEFRLIMRSMKDKEQNIKLWYDAKLYDDVM